MKKTTLFACLFTLASAAQAGTLLPPGADDLAPSSLVAAPLPDGEFERQPVAFAWAMDPKAALEAPAPFVAESREYWSVVEAGQLKSGVTIDTTAPGALIRISPAGGAKALAADEAELRVLRDGRVIEGANAFQHRASTKQLRDAGMDVPNGSAIVQLDERLGQGRFALQMPKASGRYLVHVFEPNSDVVLKAQAERGRALAGGQVEIAARLLKADTALGGALEGQLVSPAGTVVPLAFRDGKALAELPLEASSAPGLWEVQLFAGAAGPDGSLQRDARTAIEVTRPTAKLAGGYGFDAAALRLQLPVQVAAEGRYELRATLFATGPSGLAEPVAQAHAADWLAPGERKLALDFGVGNLPSGYGAPYEVRFLELKDQTRMGTLETRGLALREAGRPGRVDERRLER